MSSVAIPASLGTADQQAEQATSAVDASLVAVPEIRLPVDARGLALGILAALASVLALWWAQAFVVPLLLGIIISYTLNPLVAWLERHQDPARCRYAHCHGKRIGCARTRHLLAARSDADDDRTVARGRDQGLRRICAHAGQPRRQHTENANRSGGGRKSDGSGNRRYRDHASASHPCRRRPAAIQAR